MRVFCVYIVPLQVNNEREKGRWAVILFIFITHIATFQTEEKKKRKKIPSTPHTPSDFLFYLILSF